MRKRHLIATLAAAAATRALPAGAQTARWPERPLRLLVPFPPGNTADVVARLIADGLATRLGQPVVIENRVGAAGTLACEAIARARDGHAFLLTTASPLVISPAIQRVAYDPLRDFRPIARLGTVAVMLVGRPDLPAADLPSLLALLRRTTGGLDYASVGPGTFTHLTMELLRDALGVEMAHIPYRGAGAAHADLIGGRVALMFDSIASANTQVQAGRLRAYAVSTAARSPFAPDVPTLRESGIPTLAGFDVSVWVGLLGPAGTPDDVAAHLGAAIAGELARPGIQARLEAQSIAPILGDTPSAFSEAMHAEVALFTRLAREARLDVG